MPLACIKTWCVARRQSFANGDTVRTGQWAADGAPPAFVVRQGFGPSIEGLFFQSNLGVVTKLAIHLQPRPEAYMNVLVQVEQFDDIEQLVMRCNYGSLYTPICDI